jgi:hypothetical protein
MTIATMQVYSRAVDSQTPRMNQEGAKNMIKRERCTDSRSSLRHFQVARARAEFGGENHYTTHIYLGQFTRKMERPAQFKFGFFFCV